MSDVFISHSSKDRDAANKVCSYLEERGLTCWIAPRDIVPGTDWAAAITTAITASHVFLLIYSANSSASDQVAREMSLAETKKNVYVVPYKIDDTELKGSFEYYLIGAHWITANYGRNDYRLEELYNNIAGILGKGIQNITNNTYIDHLHIENGGDLNQSIQDAVREQNRSQQPVSPVPKPVNPVPQPPAAGRSKTPLIIGGVCLLALAAVAAIIIIASSGKEDDSSVTGDADVSSSAETSASVATTAPTATEAPVTTDTESIPSILDPSSDDTSAPGDTELKNIEVSYHGDAYKGDYKGEVSGDSPEGLGEFKGTFKGPAGMWEITYSGLFSGGKLNGQGSITVESPNGDVSVVTCNFQDGSENGEGTRKTTYKNDPDFTEYYYFGNFKNGVQEDPNGSGSYTFKSDDAFGRITHEYKGGYANDKKNGEGTRVIKYGEETKFIDFVTFSSDWKNGAVNGKGVETTNYRNGDVQVYEGDMVNGMWEGQGTVKFTFADGNYHISNGTFSNGKMTKGERINYDKNGKELSREKI